MSSDSIARQLVIPLLIRGEGEMAMTFDRPRGEGVEMMVIPYLVPSRGVFFEKEGLPTGDGRRMH